MKTYTFTARDGLEPDRTLTLTLYPNYVRVNLTGLWDQLGKIASAEDRPDEVKIQLQNQATPAVLKLLETLSGPIHLKDFAATLDEETFSIRIWQRFRGLRLLPISLEIDPVDNPEAAEAFIAELDLRSQNAIRAARFPWILDYWFTWAGMFAGFLALILWPQREQLSES